MKTKYFLYLFIFFFMGSVIAGQIGEIGDDSIYAIVE